MPGTFIPSTGPTRHKPLWQLRYIRLRSLKSWCFRIQYCWDRAQGHSTRTVVHSWPPGSLPSPPWYHFRHWARTAARFVWLATLYTYRSLPGLWYLIRYGPFMFIQWQQWRDFEYRPLDSWPEIQQEVIDLHYSR